MSIAAKIGCTAQTLNERVKKAEVDNGRRAGVPTDFAAKLKALERKNSELRQANEHPIGRTIADPSNRGNTDEVVSPSCNGPVPAGLASNARSRAMRSLSPLAAALPRSTYSRRVVDWR